MCVRFLKWHRRNRSKEFGNPTRNWWCTGISSASNKIDQFSLDFVRWSEDSLLYPHFFFQLQDLKEFFCENTIVAAKCLPFRNPLCDEPSSAFSSSYWMRNQSGTRSWCIRPSEQEKSRFSRVHGFHTLSSKSLKNIQTGWRRSRRLFGCGMPFGSVPWGAFRISRTSKLRWFVFNFLIWNFAPVVLLLDGVENPLPNWLKNCSGEKAGKSESQKLSSEITKSLYL